MEAYEPMIVALLGKTVQNIFFAVKVLDATVLWFVKETEYIVESCCYDNFPKRASYLEVI